MTKEYLFQTYEDSPVFFPTDVDRKHWLDEKFPGWTNRMATILDSNKVVVGWTSEEIFG